MHVIKFSSSIIECIRPGLMGFELSAEVSRICHDPHAEHCLILSHYLSNLQDAFENITRILHFVLAHSSIPTLPYSPWEKKSGLNSFKIQKSSEVLKGASIL